MLLPEMPLSGAALCLVLKMFNLGTPSVSLFWPNGKGIGPASGAQATETETSGAVIVTYLW
jgi:hypothetical protein